jgi:dipeptidyl-peptidase-4
VLVDQALDSAMDPARSALASIARMLRQVDIALPAAALAQVRRTPIFLHEHSGPNGMFHRNPDWLIAHGRTVEMLNGIEVSDASVFIETSKVQPGSILHELAHAYYTRLAEEERMEIDLVYRRAMEHIGYRQVKRHDGSVTDAYARSNAAEYFAELTEAYFSRNDFYPFTRAELAAYDPDGERLIAKLWR